MARLLRFPLEGLEEGVREVSREQARYLTRVHRLQVGEGALAFDPEQGVEAPVELVEVTRTRTAVRIGPSIPTPFVALPIHLVQCMGKSGKPEQVVRDATALGVAAITLVESQRTQSRLSASRASSKQARLRGVSIEAARQSGRGDLPSIRGPFPFEEGFLSCESSPGGRWVLAPDGLSLAEAVRRPAAGGCDLLVGPEGGLTAAELEQARAHGFLPVSLGSTVLRTELAAVVAVAVAATWLARARASGEASGTS